METIVVGVDGSRPSLVAVDWVGGRAARTPSRIELVRVSSPAIIPEATEELAFAEAEGRLLDVAPNAAVESTRVRGRMPEALLAAAAHADLLVIGTHRKRPLRAALRGWLPFRLATHATTPVVIVPDDWGAGDGFVVVGLDDDESSSAATEFAAQSAEAAGTELLVVHAWQMPTPQMSGSVAILASPLEEKARHQILLDDACARIVRSHPRLTVRKSLVRDNPPAALEAAAENAALLVLGTHHRGMLAGAFVGSVGQDSLATSRTPVCIVPAPTPTA